MDPGAAARNPFQPGAGTRPPVLAGRETELSIARGLLDSLEQGERPSRGLLFFGPRGNGKTALLAEVAEDARLRGMRAENLAGALGSDRKLVRRLQENVGLTGPRVRGAQAAGFGVSAEPATPTEDVEALLLAWIRAAAEPLVILVDEAHTIAPEAGRVFFGAIQEAATRSLPFLVLAAGTPDTPRRLRQFGTFLERALRRLPIGRLSQGETIRALTEPARNSGRPLADDAGAFLAAASQNYPYFIQLLGSAAWECAAETAKITPVAARRGTAAARSDIEAFYSERFQEARRRGVHRALAPLAALVSERHGALGDNELDGFLEREAGAAGAAELLNSLEDLGVLWETRPAVWEMGIPSFAEHVLARRDALSR